MTQRWGGSRESATRINSLGALRKIAALLVTVDLFLVGCASRPLDIEVLSVTRPYESAPFSVSDLLRNEGIGEGAFFGRDGRFLFEKEEALKRQPPFGANGLTVRKARTRVYKTCLVAKCQASLLLPFAGASWISSPSPSSERLALMTLDDGALGLSVYDATKGVTSAIPITPYVSVLSKFNDPLWMNDEEFFVGAAPEGRQAPQIWGEAGSARLRAARWKDAWSRSSATPTVLSTGGALGLEQSPPVGELLRVNVSTGRQEVVANGVFFRASLSHDGRFLALLQAIERAKPLSSGERWIGPPVTRQELVILDLQADNKEIYRCSGCSLLPDSLAWSPAAPSLLFFGKLQDEAWPEAGYYRIDIADTTALNPTLALPDELEPAVDYGRRTHFRVSAHWLQNDPLVYARPKGGGRSDWWRISAERAAAITRELTRAPSSVIRIEADEALFWADGALWAQNDGHGLDPRSSETDDDLGWRPVYARRADGAFAPRVEDGRLILQRKAETGRQLFAAMGLSDGAISILPGPDSGGRLLRYDDRTQTSVFAMQTLETQSVTAFTGSSGDHVRVHSFNKHLRRVEAPDIISFTYSNDQNRELNAFVLLPSDRESEERLPVIVWNYPWQMQPPSWERTRSHRLWSSNLNSVQPLVGAGFAVLIPSLPADPLVIKQNLMATFPGNIIPALDRAHDLGLVDKERAGIGGVSYGSYSTAGTIAQTDRFKAAATFAHAQLDLVSFHSSLTESSRGLPDDVEPYYRWGYTEGFIHQPPWRDPDAYRNNSPYYYVENIETPWLMLQGDLDTGAGLQQAEMMYAALVRAGKEAQLVRYWGEGHGLYGEGNIRDAYARMVEWFDYYLRDDARLKPSPE